jgi:hypothetical protein
MNKTIVKLTIDYKQICPQDFEHLHSLEEGKWYKAEIHTPEKDIGEVIFQIKEGQVSKRNRFVDFW